MIGSGIFKVPRDVAASLPSPGWILVAWVAAGLLALVGSLAFAEMSTLYPEAGGQYVFVREAFGRLTAFLYGWTNIVVINSASVAAIAFVSAEYLLCSFGLVTGCALPAEGTTAYLLLYKSVTVFLIAALTATNAVGVLWGARLQNVLTAAKLLVLGALIAGALLPGRAHLENLTPFWTLQGSMDGGLVRAFQVAFLSIFWAYDGWYLLGFSCAEIREPRRNIPIGFALGVLVVVAVYALVNLSYFAAIPLGEMARVVGPGGVGAEAARRFFGEIGLLFIALGVFGSALGAANGQILTGPRLCFAMARDGLFFRPLADVHPRFLTPLRAIVVQGGLSALCVFAGNFDDLINSVVFAAWIFYGLTVVGLFILRRRGVAGGAGTFRMPGYPILPFLFALFAFGFVIYSARESVLQVQGSLKIILEGGSLAEAMKGLYPLLVTGIILLGVPFYLAFRRAGAAGIMHRAR